MGYGFVFKKLVAPRGRLCWSASFGLNGWAFEPSTEPEPHDDTPAVHGTPETARDGLNPPTWEVH